MKEKERLWISSSIDKRQTAIRLQLKSSTIFTHHFPIGNHRLFFFLLVSHRILLPFRFCLLSYCSFFSVVIDFSPACFFYFIPISVILFPPFVFPAVMPNVSLSFLLVRWPIPNFCLSKWILSSFLTLPPALSLSLSLTHLLNSTNKDEKKKSLMFNTSLTTDQ